MQVFGASLVKVEPHVAPARKPSETVESEPLE
jgi:hypothetical protein